MSLLDTLKKNTSSPFVRSINNSFIQENTSLTWDTEVPMMNVAFSGKLDTGFQSGITVWAGPSRHFKTLYALTQLNAWFKNNHDPDNAVALLYDTEYGITEAYLEQFPYLVKHMSNILHIPVNTLEELRHETSKQVEMLYEKYRTDYKKAPKSTEKPNVFILIDSIGQVASNKETKDAVDNSEKADMTRAKMVKSIFRILTSKVKMLGIPAAIVAHTYNTMTIYSTQVVSGGCVGIDTKIIMEDGSFKNIQDVHPGDMVKTKEGPRKVMHTWDPETLEEGTPEAYDVEFEDGSVVRMSYKHKLSLNGDWVEARDMEVGMNLDEVK